MILDEINKRTLEDVEKREKDYSMDWLGRSLSANPFPPRDVKAFLRSSKEEPIRIIAEVKKATTNSNYVVIDARSEKEYKGLDKSDLRKGHIPNAVHIEYKDLIAPNGKLKTADQLRTMYTAKGVTPDKTVIIYCKTSVRAAIEFAALNSILGYNNVKVYDGAFCEWCSDKSTEVVL